MYVCVAVCVWGGGWVGVGAPGRWASGASVGPPWQQGPCWGPLGSSKLQPAQAGRQQCRHPAHRAATAVCAPPRPRRAPHAPLHPRRCGSACGNKHSTTQAAEGKPSGARNGVEPGAASGTAHGPPQLWAAAGRQGGGRRAHQWRERSWQLRSGRKGPAVAGQLAACSSSGSREKRMLGQEGGEGGGGTPQVWAGVCRSGTGAGWDGWY